MNVLLKIEEQLKEDLISAITASGMTEREQIPPIILEKSKEKEHGDFATNIAMQLARIAKKAPREIADEIVENIDFEKSSIEKVEVAGPGFINFFMKQDFLKNIVETIIQEGNEYGKTATGKGERIQVEFVSVNPTGNLHLGHARGAAYGDVLCNILEAAGYDVEREYYINDAGNQVDNLALSIEARYFEALGKPFEMPEDGYYGKDIKEIAKNLIETYDSQWVEKDDKERLHFFREYGLKSVLAKIKQDLIDFGVHFDNWFSELSLYDSGKIDLALKTLTKSGYIYEEGGATWFRSTDLSDDKDRVLIKQDGDYTYLTPDIAYHQDKLHRGFDKLINIWGADHHGYVPRMKAAIQALGYEADKMSVKIIQMVNLYEDGERVRMSKRTGQAVALRELMDDVGIDATRYFFTMRSNDSQLDFDIDLARKQSNENPVYYVQYAHARICTMLKQAEKRGFTLSETFDPSLLTSERELDLLKKLAELPQLIADCAERETPHRMTQYAFDLASLLHSFYNAEKVVNEDNAELTKARIALMNAVKITLKNVLGILGINAPESM